MDEQYTILIVEDERVVARDIQRTLTSFGYDVPATAASADQALRLATEKCPHLVLMDVQIKGDRDGIETAELLRERFDVPIVYLTAFGDPATVDRAKHTEPYGYLLKPVKANELRTVVEVALYRHEMDRRLRERERWFSTTLNSIGDAVIAVDLAGKVTFMNRVAEGLIGTKFDDARGRPASEVLTLFDDDARALDEVPVLRALREEGTVMLEEAGLVNRTSGVTRTISDSAAPVIDDGNVLGAVMVFRDVTDNKQIVRQRELADRLASLGTMAAGVVHEINNPLAVVLSEGEFVLRQLERARHRFVELEGRDSGFAKELTETIEAQAQAQAAASRIAHITSDLKAFWRPRSDARGPVDVREVVDRAIRSTFTLVRPRARLRTDLSQVPHVDANEARLVQVLVNLLINAAQAIDPGAEDVNEISIAAREDGPGYVVIEVRDTGCGMTEDELGKAFDPFFTTKPEGIGTGLGLSISRGIVAAFGGRLEAESQKGLGATFRVILHAAAPTDTAPSADENSRLPGEHRGRVLVIDDDGMVLRALTRILSQHEIVCMESAQDALDLLAVDARFDVILCDLMMPRLSGIDFYEEQLRREPDIASAIVFLTGGACIGKFSDFLDTVPNVRLEKPFDVGALRCLVQRRLAERASS
jgi:two-component system cell cycle sensor histidine kinase/response regulator CckA